MNVELCNDAAHWDAFVGTMADASNYHRWGWRNAIAETFGHEPYYFAASDGQEIRGVLPLFRMNSRLFGHFLVSMPFFSYGGVLARDAEGREALLARAGDLGRELGISHIELRQGSEQPCDWQDTTAKVTMVLPLPATVEALWKGLSSGMRNKVRNAQKNGFRVEWGGADAVGTFYKIFSTNMRNLGTPVYPQRWFLNLCKEFPDEVRVLSLFDGSEAVASGLVTCYRNELELPWSATLPESRKRYSAVFLYWTLLEWAIQNNFRLADFGRCTRGSGVYEFKRHWNSQERPLHWYYWLAPGKPLPELRPDNPRFRMATQMWKRLPVPVANLLGPRIVRSIP
ncbi:MAG TPA: FemAB family XrtA/PEP-CTERM system-associated protein [Candidatus Acidoferrales bacterium]|nr:FemAB family XrtA/PEP-CTERM system-associated protein [Candidatus Acidoferrales bacterium]